MPNGRGLEVTVQICAPRLRRRYSGADSDEADYVVSSTIFVGGGMTLYPRFEAGDAR
jgi:hypothetical protein